MSRGNRDSFTLLQDKPCLARVAPSSSFINSGMYVGNRRCAFGEAQLMKRGFETRRRFSDLWEKVIPRTDGDTDTVHARYRDIVKTCALCLSGGMRSCGIKRESQAWTTRSPTSTRWPLTSTSCVSYSESCVT